MKIIICKNCDSQFEGIYCPNCSQNRIANYRLNFKSVVTDFFDTVFNFDKGLFYTFWNLIKQPDYVVRSFIDGKRKRFTNPVKYFIISTVFQALIVYLVVNKDQGISNMNFSFLSNKINQNIDSWYQVMVLDYPIILGIINTLVWTSLVYLLFKKSNYNFTELLVVSMYFYGTVFILFNLIAVVYNPLTNKNLPLELVSSIAFIYMVFAYMRFFNKGTISLRFIRIIIVFIGLFIFRMLILPLSMAWFFPLN